MEWLSNDGYLKEFISGQFIYICDEDIPDYLFDGNKLKELTEKVGLSEHIKNNVLINIIYPFETILLIIDTIDPNCFPGFERTTWEAISEECHLKKVYIPNK